MGDPKSGPVYLSVNPQLRVEFRQATVTSDAGLLLPRELERPPRPGRAERPTPHRSPYGASGRARLFLPRFVRLDRRQAKVPSSQTRCLQWLRRRYDVRAEQVDVVRLARAPTVLFPLRCGGITR
jgi:hypothetical protein